jgi:hypothetical protein
MIMTIRKSIPSNESNAFPPNFYSLLSLSHHPTYSFLKECIFYAQETTNIDFVKKMIRLY